MHFCKVFFTEFIFHALQITLGQKDFVGAMKKLKELLDAGIITQEEFDAKKAEMLDKL